jgi:hypothetical protein
MPIRDPEEGHVWELTSEFLSKTIDRPLGRGFQCGLNPLRDRQRVRLFPSLLHATVQVIQEDGTPLTNRIEMDLRENSHGNNCTAYTCLKTGRGKVIDEAGEYVLLYQVTMTSGETFEWEQAITIGEKERYSGPYAKETKETHEESALSAGR